MAKHDELTAWQAIHQFAYASNSNPALDGSITMAPYKGWINTGSSNTLKVRNAANTAWEDVSVAGAANTPAFGSNSNSVATANVGGASTLASRADHVHLGVRSIAHTSNTFSGPITLTASGQVGITSPASGTFNINVAGAAGSGAAALTVSENFVTGNVSIASANTFYDGPSLSLVAGTYVLWGGVTLSGGNAAWVTAKLWDSTNTFDCPEFYQDTNGGGAHLPVRGTVVLGSTTTIKISATANTTGYTILATGGINGVTNKASHLVALKIA